MIGWAEGVISVVEPPITSECSGSGVVAGSGLLLLVSPSHTTDGLNSLSKRPILVKRLVRLTWSKGGGPAHGKPVNGLFAYSPFTAANPRPVTPYPN